MHQRSSEVRRENYQVRPGSVALHTAEFRVAIAGELYEASYAKVSAAGYTRYMPWKKPFEDAERFHHAVPEAYRVR